MATICITGMAGFIGFHLARVLSQSHRVVGLDSFDSFYSPVLKKLRAKELSNIGIVCEDIDLNDHEALKEFFDRHQPSRVIHLAAQPGVRSSIEKPFDCLKGNIEGFVSLLEVMKQDPSTDLIYASSSSVYGINPKSPSSEDDRTDHPASLYGASKKCNEVIAHAYHHLYRIPMVGLRFFTVYGPWGRPDMACWRFTRAILEGRPLPLFNEGRMRRDFTYIDDLIQGILATLNHAFTYNIYNLGSHESCDLLTLVRMLEKATGRKAQLELLPMQAGDLVNTCADLSLPHQVLHFTPRVSLQTGIGKFVEWYLARKSDLPGV